MKHLTFLLMFLSLSTMGWAKPQGIAKIELRTDSAKTVIQKHPEHFYTAFNAQTLESATKAKYIGTGIGLGGLYLTRQGNTGAGIVVTLLGSITTFAGRVVQDIQLVRLGWKHKKRIPKVSKSQGSRPMTTGCEDADLSVGDRVTFQPSSGAVIEGEIVDMWFSVLGLGCQILVAYELGGKRKTTTLAPSSLTKLQSTPQSR